MKLDIDRVNLPAFALAEELSPGPGDWHVHRHHQLLYASAGTLHLELERASWVLPSARAAWIAAGTPHRVAVNRPASLRTLYLDPNFMTNLPSACGVFGVEPLARELLLGAMRWGPERPADDPLAQTYFATIAGLCSEWMAAALPFRLPRAQSPELERAMAWTLEHLRESPSAGRVARVAGLSQRTMNRRFHEETGMSWREWCHAARMLAAMERLEAGERVTEVSFELGYRSLGTFSRLFHRFSGLSPRDWA